MIRRRQFLQVALPALGLALVGVGPALSETLEEKVVKTLRRQGYRDIKSSRTFLGRLRVTAEKGEKRREVILNRQTGEVLRDVIVGHGGARSVFDWDSRGDDNSGSSRADDDDRDDDRDDGGDHDSNDHDSEGGDDGGADD